MNHLSASSRGRWSGILLSETYHAQEDAQKKRRHHELLEHLNVSTLTPEQEKAFLHGLTLRTLAAKIERGDQRARHELWLYFEAEAKLAVKHRRHILGDGGPLLSSYDLEDLLDEISLTLISNLLARPERLSALKMKVPDPITAYFRVCLKHAFQRACGKQIKKLRRERTAEHTRDAVAEEMHDLLREVMDQLAPEDARILRMLVEKEETPNLVAQKLEISRATVHKRRERAELSLMLLCLQNPRYHSYVYRRGAGDFYAGAVHILKNLLQKRLRGGSRNNLEKLCEPLSLKPELHKGLVDLLEAFFCLEMEIQKGGCGTRRKLGRYLSSLGSDEERRALVFLVGEPDKSFRRRTYSRPEAIKEFTWDEEGFRKLRCWLKRLHRALQIPIEPARKRVFSSSGVHKSTRNVQGLSLLALSGIIFVDAEASQGAKRLSTALLGRKGESKSHILPLSFRVDRTLAPEKPPPRRRTAFT